MTKKLVGLFFIVNFLGGCSTIIQKQAFMPATQSEEAAKAFQNRLTLTIPLDDKDTGPKHINAEVSRPEKKISPKTLFIFVPGSGNVSRRGESSGNGVDLYDSPIEVYSLWAKALSEKGYFVLSYDKRTCNPNFNILCNRNATKDIDERGIKALSHDLDQIYDFGSSKLASHDEDTRIILVTTTQGAQVVAESACAEKAAAIVLLSPIAGDLENMWIEGLMRAHNQKTQIISKNRLRNEAESTKSFFTFLKNDKFPGNNHIHGASVKFWHSWIRSSFQTVGALVKTKRPVLGLFSAGDVFSARDGILKDKNYLQNKRNFSIKTIENTDRNFISTGLLSEQALFEVIEFIKKASK